MRWLALLVAAAVSGIVGCAASDAEESSSQDGAMELAQTLKVGAYFVDGSMTHAENNSVIHRLYERTDPTLVTESRYFDGPDLLGAESMAITETVARAICDDIRADRVNVWMVFGFSRGAFIANKAGSLALERCGRPRPVRSTGLASQYLFGGFLDAVAMSNYLVDANWIPIDTRYYHLHRADTDSSSVYPVTRFGGGIGTNERGPDLGHVDMGFTDENTRRVADETNRRTGLRIFWLR